MAIVGRRTKEVWEEYPITVDFSGDMVEGEVLAVECTVIAKEYPSGTAAPTFLKNLPFIVGDKKLAIWIQGGEKGKEYLILFRAVSSLGQKLADEWLITVPDTITADVVP